MSESTCWHPGQEGCPFGEETPTTRVCKGTPVARNKCERGLQVLAQQLDLKQEGTVQWEALPGPLKKPRMCSQPASKHLDRCHMDENDRPLVSVSKAHAANKREQWPRPAK